MANPKGRPKVENKWAWIFSESGVIPVEVRKHQGVYKTFLYDTEKQRTSFLREVKTPVFNSLEEANKNAPTFEGFNEDFLGVKEGGPRFYESKYGYELSPDMKLSIVEYRYNPASGARKEGYRRYKYNDAGQATLGKLAPGELFESPQQGIDDWNTNYTNGKLIDWQAFDDAQADLAAREPSPEEVERYYRQDIPTIDDFDNDPGMEGFDDTVYEDRNDFNDARPEKQIARQDMPTYDDASTYNDIDYTKVANKYNVDPKQLGGLLGRMGAGALDPVSEALEIALGKIGLGKIAKGWIQLETQNLLAGVLRGMAAGGATYLAETTGPAVMNLSAGRQVVQGSETPGIDALISGIEGFADQMEFSPSYQIDELVKEKTGKYGGEHLRAAASRLGKTITK